MVRPQRSGRLTAMRRRFQFSLASLLVATALVATAVNWCTLKQRAIAATHRFVATKASWDVGRATDSDPARASRELLDAELAIPFVPSDRGAWLSHLDRTRDLSRQARAKANNAMFVSREALERARSFADELLKECHDVEDRLRLPHVDHPLPTIGDHLMDD
jgi:hypothetical protein